MQPERIKAEHYGAPSEVWSLGVTLYEVIDLNRLMSANARTILKF
jgi:serine/threonine protein kinase